MIFVTFVTLFFSKNESVTVLKTSLNKCVTNVTKITKVTKVTHFLKIRNGKLHIYKSGAFC